LIQLKKRRAFEKRRMHDSFVRQRLETAEKKKDATMIIDPESKPETPLAAAPEPAVNGHDTTADALTAPRIPRNAAFYTRAAWARYRQRHGGI
jgi:hypothetical protein